jgi:ubiquitin C-terminal hydrolase
MSIFIIIIIIIIIIINAGLLMYTGRAADSGHYISYVKRETGEWVCFDDDKITVIKEVGSPNTP